MGRPRCPAPYSGVEEVLGRGDHYYDAHAHTTALAFRVPIAVDRSAMSSPAAQAEGVEPRPGRTEQDVSEAPRGGPPRRPWTRRLVATITTPSFLALAAPIVFLGILGWLNRWVSDDGWINIRVVEQFFAGNGPVFNPDERVEVTTSTLWFWMLLGCQVLFRWAEVQVAGASLGVVLTVWALIAATLAGRELLRDRRHQLLLPLGTLVIAALPPFWDFASSGLETGLSFAWTATGFWMLTRRIDPHRLRPLTRRWPVLTMVWFGLGPLVRPDLALYSVIFVIALFCTAPRQWWRFVLCGIVGCIVPLTYEVWRMGYFALLVPNTALAKDASNQQWEQGLAYLINYVGLYLLAAPLLVCGLVVAAQVRLGLREHSLARVAVVAAPVVAGLAHAFYVVRVGGDFMHARFLLPPTLAVLLPASVIGVPRAGRQQVLTALAFLCGWSVVVAGGVRAPNVPFSENGGIADERSFWIKASRTHKALTRREWFASNNADLGRLAYWDNQNGWSYFSDKDWKRRPTINGKHIYLTYQNMGILAVAAGTDVRILDELALADGITSHSKIDPRLVNVERIGHHPRPEAWRLARYAAPLPDEPLEVQDARAAMRCGTLAQLQTAITGKMTRKKFINNIKIAPKLTRFTFPSETYAARAELCGPGR